jgi:hypothetical protein
MNRFQILILILILFIKYRTIECILHTNLINGENITLLWKISQDFESFVVAIIIGQLLQISVSQMITDMLLLSWTQSRTSTLFFTYILTSTYVNVSNTTDDNRRWIAYPSGADELNTGVLFGSCWSIHYLVLLYYVMLTIVSLFVLFLLYFLISINGFC